MSPTQDRTNARTTKATILAEHTIDGVSSIAGVTFDGEHVWFADGTRGGLVAVDPESGKTVRRFADVPADAGTAFDGTLLYQIAGDKIQKIDLKTGKIVGTIPAPPNGQNSGLAFAEGALWVGQYRERCIQKVDPRTGKILKTIRSDRFVTGVSFIEGQLWHGTSESDEADIRRVDPESGTVLHRLTLPKEVGCSGIEADDKGRIWVGDSRSGRLRAVERPQPKDESI